MNHNLINLFDKAAESPEFIPKLRQLILDLAVRGKLVSQDSKDEPVTMSLAKNDKERLKCSENDHRADKETQSILAGEYKWDIPDHWEWRGLADLVLFIDYRGKTPEKIESGVRLITAKNVRRGFVNTLPEEFISEETYKEWMTRGIPKQGDVLFTTEAPLGNAAVVRLVERFALAQRVINFRSYGAVIPDFLVLELNSQPFQFILDKTGTGLTAKGIKAAKLKRLPVVVPPLTEQKRIVAKVDELMSLCDDLEKQISISSTKSTRLLNTISNK